MKKSNATRTANGSWDRINAKGIATRTANGWYEKTIPKIKSKSRETLDKQVATRRNTMLSRYGSTHAGGGRSKLKTVIIFGHTFNNIQGYEDILIYELLISGILPNDIIPCSRLSQHAFTYNLNGATHHYYPDVYVKSIDKYYEAKSVYWYNIDKDLADIKSKSVTTNYEMRIYDAKYTCKIRRIIKSGQPTKV